MLTKSKKPVSVTKLAEQTKAALDLLGTNQDLIFVWIKSRLIRYRPHPATHGGWRPDQRDKQESLYIHLDNQRPCGRELPRCHSSRVRLPSTHTIRLTTCLCGKQFRWFSCRDRIQRHHRQHQDCSSKSIQYRYSWIHMVAKLTQAIWGFPTSHDCTVSWGTDMVLGISI